MSIIDDSMEQVMIGKDMIITRDKKRVYPFSKLVGVCLSEFVCMCECVCQLSYPTWSGDESTREHTWSEQ